MYLGYCFVCHGQNGDGNGPYADKLSQTPPDFTNHKYFEAKSDTDLYNFISKGGVAHGKSIHMKPFGFQLSQHEIQNIVDYIRVLHRKEKILRVEGTGYSGREIYENSCVMCHGENGKGDGKLAKMLDISVEPLSPKALSNKQLAEVHDIIKNGVSDDKTGAGKYMPAWGQSLTDQEIGVLISYISSFED